MAREEDCPARQPADDAAAAQFTVVSYNILSRSLGSNCVPWVMNVRDESLVRSVEEAVGASWSAWKEAEVLPEYRRHFHKNLGTGDYTTMRRLWSRKQLESQADIPSSLQGVTFHARDQVTYATKEGERAVASTMRGVLQSKLPEDDLGVRLFGHLMELEDEVYDWSARGPRLFREILARRALRPLPAAAPCETDDGGGSAASSADIVILQEYDAHTAMADYRSTGAEESFRAAMEAEGYAGILFKDPLKGRNPVSGLGIFWRRATFRISGSVDADGDRRSWELECGESLGDGVARNVDFMERWHRLRGSAPVEQELMPEADRRHVVSVQLEHIASGRRLRVLSAHLMTTSRDSESSNEFPGEVRAGELRTVREELRRVSTAGEAVLVAGDFNTDAGNLGVLTGSLASTLTGKPLLVPTGLEQLESGGASASGSACRSVRWRASEHGEPPFHLREAFESVHRWGDGVGEHGKGKSCTSSNAERTEWIDYVWYGEASLRPLALSDCLTPVGPIPDRDHGSDHLPVVVRFEFASGAPGTSK